MSKPTWATCPVCDKERALTRSGRFRKHNRWDGTKMVDCTGSLSWPVQVDKLPDNV